MTRRRSTNGRGNIWFRARSPPVSAFGEQLARLPLELGCRLTQQEAAPLLAAFLQPWQIVFKQTGRLVADVEALRLSSRCSYRTPLRGRQVLLGEGEPVARVPFFNTLDAAGAAVKAVTSASTAPCGAKCRGACGADCSSPLCTVKSSGCEYVCPTHSFCRFHDACYDQCNSAHLCWSPLAWLCKRGCDDRCLQNYSEATCAAWSQGLGPSDGAMTFNECSGGGSGCTTNELDWLQVVREPGITAAEMVQGEARSERSAPGARLEWRQWGLDTVFALSCDDGPPGDGDGGGGDAPPPYCTHCSCQGEYTSWEGEVCGSSTAELIDECSSSCY